MQKLIRIRSKEVVQLFVATFLALVLITPLTQGANPKDVNIQHLIHKLGSANFKEREAATKDLENLADKALIPLYDAAQNSTDAETRRRAKALITRILEVGSKKHELWRTQGPTLSASGFAFSSDQTKVLSFCSNAPQERAAEIVWTVRLWDVRSGKQLRLLEGYDGPMRAGGISPDGRLALGAGFDNHDCRILLWDLETGKVVKELVGHTRQLYSVVFSPDGRFALSASNDQTVRLWDLQTGKEVHCMKGHSGGVGVVRAIFSPDGKVGLSCGGKTVRVWDLKTGRQIRCLQHGVGSVWCVAMSVDGRRALSGSGIGLSRDCTVRLWDLEKGKEIKAFVGHNLYVQAVAFSRDGRFALSGSRDQTVRVWDIERGLEIRRFKAEGTVISLAITRDGKAVLGGIMQKNLVQCWALPE